MRAVAYCRVSTNKEEQIDSLGSQQKFFKDYASNNKYELVKIYADEGKSGTKMKNRTMLKALLNDAKRDMFDIVLIKDVSRLARNTLDFLTSIRNLKSLGIKVVFVNYDQTTSDSSEFMLTMLSAIAQEESANTSKRVKFGKRQNAKCGKVPNLVYGYDKVLGDYFNLIINEKEAEVVKRIFYLYTTNGLGAGKIATCLNEEGIKTKRGCNWTQTAIKRVLTNEIYIGNVVNGKQEVEDFLTGRRKDTEKENWIITKRPELSIVDSQTFMNANRILKNRQETFNHSGKRNTGKYVFSQLLLCPHCGSTFRRIVRSYKNTYVTWVCNGRNSNGSNYCKNATSINEVDLLKAINDYFLLVLSSKPHMVDGIIKEFNKQYKDHNQGYMTEKEYRNKLHSLLREKDKYIELYTHEVITLGELKQKTEVLNQDIEICRLKIDKVLKGLEENNLIEETIYNKKEMVELFKLNIISNEFLKHLIEKIDVDKDGNVNVQFLNLKQ